MLTDQLHDDLVRAMKARDKVTTSTLRLALGAIREAEVAGATARVLGDDETQAVLAAEVKKRSEAAAAYDNGGRPEKAAAERAEARVLAVYLPAVLDDSELAELVDATLRSGGYSTRADMGAAMQAMKVAVAGRADGRKVAELVKARLA